MPEVGSGASLDRILKHHAPRVVASTWASATEEMVKACHEEGILVFVDDGGPETWQTLFEWGVDGIQTDHVSGLIEAVKAYSEEAARETVTDQAVGVP